MESNNLDKELILQEKTTIGLFILRIVQGFLIGGGAIIPGISGGVLCVAFGIYRPMMALIAHPFRTFKKYYMLFIPVIIGGALGFVGLAGAVKLLYDASPAIASCLFAGLVAGTLPMLIKDAGKNGTSNSAWSGFVITLFVSFGVLVFLGTVLWAKIDLNIWWYLFSGVVWGLSLVVPGLSTSSILYDMGLYVPIMDGVKNLDFGVILPLFAGIGAIAILLARFVNYIFERHYTIISHAIIGIVISSTLLIIPTKFNGTVDAVFSILCFFVGFVIAWGMDKYGSRIKKD